MLAEYRAIHSGSKDIEGFLHVEPLSILKCVPDMTYHAAKLIHKEGSLDSLAMLTSVTIQTALSLGLTVGVHVMQAQACAFHNACIIVVLGRGCCMHLLFAVDASIAA